MKMENTQNIQKNVVYKEALFRIYFNGVKTFKFKSIVN